MSAAAWVDELKSGPGRSRLLEQRGPQLAVGALLIVLAMDCALILTRALARSALPPPSATPVHAAPVRPAPNPTLELANIVNSHLFGIPGVQAGGAAPQTTMPLILAGVIADKDPSKGRAIIGDSAAAGKLYAVGAMIPGGVRLHAVFGDHVLIERNGRLETLLLPRTPMKGSAPPPPIGLAPAAAVSSLRDNSTVLAGLVRVQPVFNQGKLSGYRVFPGGARGASTFNQLGLRSGDMILAINGTPLDDAARAMEVLQTLSSSATATVTVSRNGQSQEVNLNLANLSSDLEAPATDNAAGTAGAAGGQVPGVPGAMRMRGTLQAVPGNPEAVPGAVPAPNPGAAAAPTDAAPPANNAAGSER